MGDRTQETGDSRQETQDRRQKTQDRRQETQDRRQETGDRRQETGDTRQETGDERYKLVVTPTHKTCIPCKTNNFFLRFDFGHNTIADRRYLSVYAACLAARAPGHINLSSTYSHAHKHACTHARTHARTHAHTHARTHAVAYVRMPPNTPHARIHAHHARMSGHACHIFILHITAQHTHHARHTRHTPTCTHRHVHTRAYSSTFSSATGLQMTSSARKRARKNSLPVAISGRHRRPYPGVHAARDTGKGTLHELSVGRTAEVHVDRLTNCTAN